MAKIRINGDTSGYIEISAPAVAGSTSITLPATTGGSLLATDANGNLNVDSGLLYVDGVNNRVGIGTTSPSTLLHLNSSGASSVYLRTENTGGIGYFGVDSSGNAYAGAESNDAFGLVTNGTYRMYITAGGNVGIGTTSIDFSQFGSNTGGVAIADIGATNTGLKLSDGSFHNYLVQAGNGNFYLSHYGASGDLVFSNGASGEERARIDFSGRLLIGSSASVYSSSLLTVKGGISTSVGDLNLASTVANITSGNDIGAIRITNTNGWRGAQIIATADGNWTEGSSQPTYLGFSVTASGATNPTERVAIYNGGLLMTSPSTDGCLVRTSTGAGTSFYLFAGNRNRSAGETTVYYVWSNGNVQNTNGSYTAISDVKLKENIVDANSQWDDLKAIKIRNWNFKEETGHETHRQIGPIAQELEQVCPGLVFDSPDRDENGNNLGTSTKGVNQSVLYMKAVKALQEAQLRIEQLEATNASFEARLSALEVKP